QGAHSAPSSAAMTKVKTCRLGSSQWCMANMDPKPPHHPAYAARRPVGAPRASRIHGTRATEANHHRDGAGKARTGRAPTTTAAAERYHGEASQWPSVFIGASLPPEDPS